MLVILPSINNTLITTTYCSSKSNHFYYKFSIQYINISIHIQSINITSYLTRLLQNLVNCGWLRCISRASSWSAKDVFSDVSSVFSYPAAWEKRHSIRNQICLERKQKWDEKVFWSFWGGACRKVPRGVFGVCKRQVSNFNTQRESYRVKTKETAGDLGALETLDIYYTIFSIFL